MHIDNGISFLCQFQVEIEFLRVYFSFLFRETREKLYLYIYYANA